MDDEKQYPPALVELFDLIMNPTASAGAELVKRLEPVFRDAERYRWLRDEAHDWEDAKIISLYAGPDFERATGEELDAIIDIEMAPKRYVLGAA